MSQLFVIARIRIYREGLVGMLDRDERIEVVGAAASIPESIAEVLRLKPHAVLLDYHSADDWGEIEALTRQLGPTKVVVLGLAQRPTEVVACAEAGAVGFVSRESSLEQLADGIERAVHGEVRCDDAVAGALFRRVGKLAALSGGQEEPHLTPRELEIAELLEEALTNQEIAHRLHIEVATVKIHLHSIFEKLGVHHRGQVPIRLRRLGVFTH